MVGTIEDIDEDMSASDIDKLGDDWSQEQEKQGEALQAYVGENCEFSLPGMEDLEGELPESP
jgi:hypothetical protein